MGLEEESSLSACVSHVFYLSAENRIVGRCNSHNLYNLWCVGGRGGVPGAVIMGNSLRCIPILTIAHEVTNCQSWAAIIKSALVAIGYNCCGSVLICYCWLQEIGLVHMRIVEGCNSIIQLAGLLGRLCQKATALTVQ